MTQEFLGQSSHPSSRDGSWQLLEIETVRTRSLVFHYCFFRARWTRAPDLRHRRLRVDETFSSGVVHRILDAVDCRDILHAVGVAVAVRKPVGRRVFNAFRETRLELQSAEPERQNRPADEDGHDHRACASPAASRRSSWDDRISYFQAVV